MKRLACLALGAVLVCTVAGCVKITEEILVMPDGSGKLVYTFAMNPEFGGMGGEAKDPFDELMNSDPAEFEKNSAGIVAMGRPERAELGGWKGVRITFYFEDINKVRLSEDDGKKEKMKFSFKKDGDGYAFEVVDNQMGEAGGSEKEPPDEETKKQMEEMFQKMMAGFDYRASVKLPGKVKAVEGYTAKDGRTASISVGEKDVKNQKDFKKLGSRKATCGASEMTDAEVADFKKELEKAKAGWPTLKDEMKKNAEKKKGEEKKDNP
ncbi:MAG: hypothetical protein HYY17_05410 [Planctomycetes bacterium]|nr:hypothetical protein [Planctomycetota bacterium]